jgi:hypothetical protein
MDVAKAHLRPENRGAVNLPEPPNNPIAPLAPWYAAFLRFVRNDRGERWLQSLPDELGHAALALHQEATADKQNQTRRPARRMQAWLAAKRIHRWASGRGGW